MTTMETIAMVMVNVGDDAAFGRVVRALMAAQIDRERAKPEPDTTPVQVQPVPTLALSCESESVGRSHGKTFDTAFGVALAAAVRAHGGRVEWTSRHVMETVPGYRGNTARAIGNALGQWSRAWRSSKTTFHGLRVVDVLFNQREDDRACAVYVIESLPAA